MKLVGKYRLERMVAVHLADVGRDHGTSDQLGQAQICTLKDEERTEGDQEAGDAGAHRQIAIQESDGQREEQRQQRTDPEIDPELVAEHRVEEHGGENHDASRQIELSTDHQHSDPDRDDADRRGRVEDGGE
ncbi:MAG: hypothetical protein NVV60_06860 [Luteimonas sp.]|nr:hypothetical protein [Luteimonas sp.]